jgi:hypothetical protein
MKIETAGLLTIADALEQEGRRLAAGCIREAAAEISALRAAQVGAGDGAENEPGATLDGRLKAAGMFTVTEMMGQTPLSRWQVHAGMSGLEAFGEWLDRKTAEYTRMRAGYELGDKDKSDELYEWVLAHSAAFATIRANFIAARDRQAAVNVGARVGAGEDQATPSA